MMKDATGYHPDRDVDTRWVIETWFRGTGWAVIVEPEADRELLDVVKTFQEDPE